MNENRNEQKLQKVLKQDVIIPKEVNSRIDAVNEMILNQNKGKGSRRPYRKWVVAAATVGLLCVSSLGVLAATGFFSKNSAQSEEALEYKFDINYELTSHEIKVTPGYLPENYQEWERDKYSENGEWAKPGITIAAYTMANIDAMNSTLEITDGTLEEETTLNDLEAHVVRRENDGINDSYNTVILFNQTDGYVVEVMGSNQMVPIEELKKVADGLEIEVLPEEAEYLPEEDKTPDTAEIEFDGTVPQDHVLPLGQEARLAVDYEDQGTSIHREMGYTVTDIKVVDSIADYAQENFYRYEDLAPWITEAGTLKPYDRILFGRDGTEIDRGSAEQKFVELTIQAQNYGDQPDYLTASYGLVELKENSDGTFTVDETITEAVASDSYMLQTDHAPIYFDQPVSISGDERDHRFFLRNLEPGEALNYKVLYVIDADRTENLGLFLNYPGMELTNDLDDAQLIVNLK